jgi:hypothetical protein
VAITSPVTVSGHLDTPVSCSVTGVRYTESAAGALRGSTISEAVRVVGYQGPGTYRASVTVSVVSAGVRDAVTAVPTTAHITGAGGDVSFSGTTGGGRVLAGSIVWACGA